MKSINQMDESLRLAEKVCREKGARLTYKRRQVLAILLNLKKAISAYELIELYQQEYDDTLSPMSAYRILEFLEQQHLAHKINIVNKFVACAHIGQSHCHQLPQFLFCQKCQSVSELPNDSSQLNDLARRIEQTGHQLTSPQIELTCICQDCLSSEAEQ